MNKSKLILISGPSAAGKTSVAQYMKENFAGFEHIRQDDYLKDPETFPLQGQYKIWEDPGNIMFDVLGDHVKRLLAGQPVAWRTFARDERDPVYHYILQPKPYILLEGTLIFTNQFLLGAANKKIYLDIPLRVSLQRRLERSKIWGIDLGEYDQVVMIPAIEKWRYLKNEAGIILDASKKIEELAWEIKKLSAEN